MTLFRATDLAVIKTNTSFQTAKTILRLYDSLCRQQVQKLHRMPGVTESADVSFRLRSIVRYVIYLSRLSLLTSLLQQDQSRDLTALTLSPLSPGQKRHYQLRNQQTQT